MYLYKLQKLRVFTGLWTRRSYYGKSTGSGRKTNRFPLRRPSDLHRVQQLMGDYNNSKNNYQLYISTHSGEEQALSEQAQMQIQACEYYHSKDNENKEK